MSKFSNLKTLFLTFSLSLLITSTQAQPAKPANAKPQLKGKPAAEKPVTSPKETQRKWSVYFDVNQSRIKSEGYKVLDSVIHMLKTQTNIRRIQITGYADTTGGAEANMILSDSRTDTVSGYILSHDLMSYKNKTSTASLGEKVTGKETDLNEMRRVDVVLFMARPDRDTLIRNGCVTALVKANTFDGFNNDEVTFKIEYVKSIEEAKKYNLSFKDNEGNNILTSGAVRVTAIYRGKPVKATKPIVVTMPKANSKTGYSLYRGTEDKSKNVTWKKTDNMVTEIPVSSATAGDDCGARQSTSLTDLNVWFCAGMKLDCHCSPDPFGGVEAPAQDNALARFGPDQTIVLLSDACFKKIGADKAYVQVADNLFPGEFLNFCNSFLLPGVGDVPEIPKFDREIVKFIDFNVSQKNDSADMIMVKKTKMLIMIPKSKYPAHPGKQYAILPADTRKDNFSAWTTKVVFNDACQGIVNCDYWVFEAPFSGFYTLLELTPNEDNNPRKRKGKNEDNEEAGPAPKYITIKTKKLNDVHIIYGLKQNDKTETATFVKNKGKNSYNMPAITKKEKKEYKDYVFMAYVIKDGKRYAWIGKGSQIKKGFLSGKWKTPKLVYVPDEEWENFVRKACE